MAIELRRRLNVSQSVTIQTELTPLSDNFWLTTNGSTEQWYYDNYEGTPQGPYSPNREETPLQVTPNIQAIDRDTGTSYSPNFNTIQWYALEYVQVSQNPERYDWVETRITNQSDVPEEPYFISNQTLYVKKNVSFGHGVTIRCTADYTDPRDEGTTYAVERTLLLSTSRDATVVYPKLSILNNQPKTFNPLSDATSQFTYTAKAVKGETDITNSTYFIWYAKENDGAEVLADTLLCYVSGQNTSTLVIDMMYAENITLILKAKESQSAVTLYPDKAYHTIAWRIPDIDAHVLSYNGGAVRSDTQTMRFGTIINMKGNELSSETKLANLQFHWFTRKSNNEVQNDLGWGPECTIPASTLKGSRAANQVMPSSAVYYEAFLLSPNMRVTHNGDVVTSGGDVVVARKSIETNNNE